MSATNRGFERNERDYYITPSGTIRDFFDRFLAVEPEFKPRNLVALDPCAGGDVENEMPYPKELLRLGCLAANLDTMDIRPDSPAEYTGDYLAAELGGAQHNCIISNPPYNLATEFIKKALEEVVPGGFVIMLLRINFFGSQARNAFWQQHMPKWCFIHSKRPSFFTDSQKKALRAQGITVSTDATEYAHFVWQKGEASPYCRTLVV